MLVIDVAHAAWHAWERRTTGGESAFDALRGRLHTLAARFGDVVLAVDMPPYERADETLGGSPTYKANRASDEAGRAAVRAMLDGLRADGWRMVGVQGHEADDVCATLARQAHERGERITVATSDKDLLPLVDVADVWWLGSDRIITPDDVRAKWGVEPAQLHDLLALMGDDSDGIAGVPGIGQQKGAALLQHYRNIDAIIADLPAAKETIDEAAKALATKRKRAKAMPDGDERRAALALADEAERLGKIARAHALVHAHRGAVELARRLVRLRSDLPIALDESTRPRPEPIHGAGVVVTGDCYADGREAAHTPCADLSPATPRTAHDLGDEPKHGMRPAHERPSDLAAIEAALTEQETMSTKTAETITEAEIAPVAQPLALRPAEPAPVVVAPQPTAPRRAPASMTMEEAMMSVPASLAGALVDAQSRIRKVAKDSVNSFHRYKYAASEDMIDEARGALNDAGLALMSHWKVDHSAYQERDQHTDRGSKTIVIVGRVVVSYTLIHRSGEALRWITSTPIIPEAGRPEDKAEMAALTANLGYTLRQLLLIPRGDDDGGVDQRDDRNYQPRPPAPQQRRAS